MEETDLNNLEKERKNKSGLLIFFFILFFVLAGFFVYKYRSADLERKESKSVDLGSIQSPSPSPVGSNRLEFEINDASESGQVRNIDGMKIEDLKVGSGEEAVNGKLVIVDYVGKLTDGTVFDSSKNFGKPFGFVLGNGEVIKGWEKGILGMKVGGKRKLTIPPELAYGDREMGDIPANSILIFEVDLLEIKGVK